MWRDYQERKYDFGVWGDFLEQEAMARQYVGWLNNETLEVEGKFIERAPVETREIFSYWAIANWPKQWLIEHDEYTRFDNLPAREWPRPRRGRPAILSW
ncbi:hypothetical protein FB45DRAFT_949645 [Roridomyces roridus]|uniref:Uncharacterized protein n=1 Tax=Roridomyces roridus TaxID=1738132 RepID=A0AAD7F791_9AGAR|nr:hypothetical protein FB45DRAFT_949645 [Roridomyces roridus]